MGYAAVLWRRGYLLWTRNWQLWAVKTIIVVSWWILRSTVEHYTSIIAWTLILLLKQLKCVCNFGLQIILILIIIFQLCKRKQLDLVQITQQTPVLRFPRLMPRLGLVTTGFNLLMVLLFTWRVLWDDPNLWGNGWRVDAGGQTEHDQQQSPVSTWYHTKD